MRDFWQRQSKLPNYMASALCENVLRCTFKVRLIFYLHRCSAVHDNSNEDTVFQYSESEN
jgi:hypothetical protein